MDDESTDDYDVCTTPKNHHKKKYLPKKRNYIDDESTDDYEENAPSEHKKKMLPKRAKTLSRFRKKREQFQISPAPDRSKSPVASKKRVNRRLALDSGKECCREVGTLIWGQMSLGHWWPGIIVKRVTGATLKLKVYWYGDHKISKVRYMYLYQS